MAAQSLSNRHRACFCLTAAGSLLLTMVVANAQEEKADSWTRTFALDAEELVTTGRNRYFILEPGYSWVLESDSEQLTITVLDETQRIGPFDTRVVEERETVDGELTEISRNYFALGSRTNGVYYFGEDVDVYRRGRLVDHEGAWRAEADGARAGLMMPGEALLGARYYQEYAPEVAMDRAEIVSLNEVVTTPAGEFSDCLRVKETTPLERFATEYKYYAPNVGLVRDGALRLVRYGPKR
jgi:hypothetical protein